MLNQNDDLCLNSGWNSLRAFGVEYLTGEACAFSLRVLCDLNEDGRDLMTEYLGGNINFNGGSNWNSRVNGKDAVASILLSRDALPALLKYIVYLEGYMAACVAPDGAVYGTNNPEHVEVYRRMKFDIYTNYSNRAVSRGGRNIHVCTGRTI